ncbi:MAG: DUF5696 domain-containing protein [Clostridia bacterium]|nr:DUF5696 domain-containing protein [Clostridia bacterium]
MKRIKSFVLCVVIAMTAVLCAFADETTTTTTTTTTSSRVVAAQSVSNVLATLNVTEDLTGRLVAQSANMDLYLVMVGEYPNILLVDRRTNHEWMSWCPEGMLMGSMNRSWTKKVNSMFTLNYVKYSEKKSVATEISAADGEVVVEDIENGVRLRYDFSDISVSLAMDITLDGDILDVRFPFSEISESEDYGITSIEAMTNFGASAGDMPGYVFYPDGSGALLRNKNYSTVDKASKYSWQIYGVDNYDISVYDVMERTDLQQAYLPVFGIKQNDSAYLAVVGEGASDSILNLYPSGYITGLNRVGTEFVYRRFYNTPRQDGEIVLRSEKNIIESDHEIKYIFIADGAEGYSADYNGMANAYRDYLLDNGQLNNALEDETQMPFALNLFMGINATSLLFDEYVSMTTFDQAEEIYNALSEKGVSNILLNLIGWQKDGYGRYPDKNTPASQLGGAGALKELAKTVNTSGGRLLLNLNVTDANSKYGGFSTRRDVLYTNSQMLVTDSDSEKYIISPTVAFENFKNNYVGNILDAGASGVTFERIGKYLYNDYNEGHPITRGGSADVWAELFEETKNTVGSVAVSEANAYTFASADHIYNAPISDSGYFITDERVPFYEMVVHGYIPYSTKAANLFHDSEKQTLEWVEYGCVPFYELTHEESSNLKDTDYNELFTSLCDDWIEPAGEKYAEMAQRLGNIWKQPMVRHDKMDESVFRVTYASGDMVYVNYNNYAVTVDGVAVEAMDYAVVMMRGGAAQ